MPVSGITRPDAVTVSGSFGWITMRFSNGIGIRLGAEPGARGAAGSRVVSDVGVASANASICGSTGSPSFTAARRMSLARSMSAWVIWVVRGPSGRGSGAPGLQLRSVRRWIPDEDPSYGLEQP